MTTKGKIELPAVNCAHDRLVPPGKLKANPENPNKHPAEQLAIYAKIIRHQGWRKPIVVSKQTGWIVTGHGAWLTAKKEGWPTVPVDYQDFKSRADEFAHLVADNRLPQMAEFDDEILAKIVVNELPDFDLDLTGLSGLEQDTLARAINPVVETAPPDTSAANLKRLRKKWKVESGQLWHLGEHRLLCGDCRDPKSVAKLLGKEKVNVAFTSPPYAEQREYDENSGFKPIPPKQYVEWFKPIAENVRTHIAADGSWFINIKPSCHGLDTELYVFDLVIAHVRDWGWHFATEFCWERNGMPKSVQQRFKNQFEPIYQFALNRWKMRAENVRHASDHVPIPFGKGAGNTSWANKQGGNGAVFGGAKRRKSGTNQTMSDVQGQTKAPGEFINPGLAFPGNRLPTFCESHQATGHTAAFPVGLPSFFIKAYSDGGDLVFDPFLGSGTTLIACEQLARRCRAMEISTEYVAVALQRWADATGKTPRLA